MVNFKLQLFLLFICIKFYHGTCFYLSGPGPVNYCEESKSTGLCQNHVKVFGSKLNSESTFISYDYNHFDFCGTDECKSPAENLFQIIFGERIRGLPYNVSFLKDVNCAKVCQKTYNLKNTDDIAKINKLKEGMLKNYQHNWIVDSMPVTWCYRAESVQQYCSIGFDMGCYVDSVGNAKGACIKNAKFNKEDTFYLFNHVDIMIEYHSGEDESWGTDFKDKGGRIIAIKVNPRSMKNQFENGCSVYSDPVEIPNVLKGNILAINYTYSIKFIKNNIVKWSSRWDYIVESMQHTNVLLFSTMNSFVIVLFLTGMVALILFRRLHKDVHRYNKIQFSEDPKKEFGWRIVHGDVFRPPQKGMLLSVLLGSGVQVFFTALITLCFAYFGLVYPGDKGALMQFAMVLTVSLGSPAGYTSAMIYRAFGGITWKSNGMIVSTLCSGFIFVTFFVVNLILWIKESNNAAQCRILLAVLSLWFGVNFLFTYTGAYFGFKKRTVDDPVEADQTPREIPKQSIFNKPICGVIIGGIFPFVCIFYQLFFILTSIWSNQMYFSYGNLILTFILLVIACSEITILLCYFHLHAEDYSWWWRSFLTTGFSGFYMFLYCIFFFYTKLNVSDVASILLYFSYTLLMCFLFFLLTGTIGFFACYWFVMKIYGVLKQCKLPPSAQSLYPVSFEDNCSKVALVDADHMYISDEKSEKCVV